MHIIQGISFSLIRIQSIALKKKRIYKISKQTRNKCLLPMKSGKKQNQIDFDIYIV